MRKLGLFALSILGVWCLIEAIALLTAPATAALSYDPSWGDLTTTVSLVAVNLVAPVGLFVVGLVLLRKRQALADRLFPEGKADLAVDAAELLRLALIVVGVVLVARMIPALIGWLAMPLADTARNRALFGEVEASTPSYITQLPSLVVRVTELAIGLCLVLFSRPLSAWLWGGRSPQPDATPDAGALPRCPACDTVYDPSDYRLDAEAPRCVECHTLLDRPHA